MANEPTTSRPVVSSSGNSIKESELPAFHDKELEWTKTWGTADTEEEQIKSLKGVFGRESVAPGTDAMTVRPEMRKKYGVGDKTTLCWKLNPQVKQWGELTGNQSIDHWLAAVPGAHIVEYDAGNGKKSQVTNGDLILCGYPEVLDKAYTEWQKEQQETLLHDTQGGGDYKREEIGRGRFRDDPNELRAMRDEEHDSIIASGMIGQWTGQQLANVMNMLGSEKCKEIARESRGGYAEIEERMAEAQSSGGGRSGGGAVVSIPNNVRPRNFAGAKK